MSDNDIKIDLKEYLEDKFRASQRQIQSVGHRLEDIEKVLTRLTVTVEIHEKRSTHLEAITAPVVEDFQRKTIYAAEKAKRRKELRERIRTPALVLGTIATCFGAEFFAGVLSKFWTLFKGLMR